MALKAEHIKACFNTQKSPSEIQKLFTSGKSNPLINFYLNLLFYNHIDSNIHDFEIPSYLIKLLGSYKIIKYLILAHLEIQLEEQHFLNAKSKIVKTHKIEKDEYSCIQFLIDIEKSCPLIADTDSRFILKQKITINDLKVGPEPTPLKILLESKGSFEVFFASEGKPDSFEICHGLINFENNFAEIKFIQKAIESSSFPQIRNKIFHFFKMYPELKSFDQKFSKDRLKFIKDPFSMPLEYRILRTYIPICAEESIFSGSEDDSPKKILNLFYIEKILKNNPSKNLLKEFLASAFSEEPELFEYILKKKIEFDVENFVKWIKITKNFFEDILKMLITTKDQYYAKFADAILLYYPFVENIQILKSHSLSLESKFLEKYKSLIEDLEIF